MLTNNINRSNIKHLMSPKYYQVITIQGESKGFKPIVKGEHKTASEYLRENHGTLSLPSDPAPNSLPLKGERVSSQPSLKLSSSRGVWQPRKWKKMRENRREEEKRENWSPSRQKFIHWTKILFYNGYKWLI